MSIDFRASAFIILTAYALLAVLERSPALRFKPSRLLRPFFTTDVAWYLAAVAVTMAASPWLQQLAGLRAAAGIAGFEQLALPFPVLLLIALVIYDFCTFVAHRAPGAR